MTRVESYTPNNDEYAAPGIRWLDAVAAMNPRPLLHLEGAAVLAVGVLAYHSTHGSWLLFVLLFLVPDLSMIGYVANVRLGAIAYNAVHTYVGPLVLAAYAFGMGQRILQGVSLIWIAHIGFDRMLGYGLKYPTRFKDTHLNPDRHTLGIGNPSFGKLWQDDKRIESNRRKHAS
jgi:hypothetical protein